MNIPATEHKGRIRDTVSAVLSERRTSGPIVQGELAREVSARLGLRGLKETTLRRRTKEAVAELVAAGLRIASDAKGYRLIEGKEDEEAGRKYLARQVAGIARRLRSYEAAAGEQLAQFALQLGR